MERARERVAILLDDVGHSALVDFGCVSSRILWIKFKFSRVKVCVVLVYGPNEGDGEERDRFWNDMDKTLDSVGNGYRLGIVGDLNGWIRDRTRGDCVWVKHILRIEICISTQKWQGEKMEWR